MLAGLFNFAVWLTPPPIHFIAPFLPFFSGHSIARDRPAGRVLHCAQIGLVMGLTLGTVITGLGLLAVGIISLIEPISALLWVVVVICIGAAIGGYSAVAGYLGALVAASELAREAQARAEREAMAEDSDRAAA